MISAQVVLVLGGPTSDVIRHHIDDQQWSRYFLSLRLVDLGVEYARGHAASLLAAARVLLGPTQVPRPFLLVPCDHVYDHNLLRDLVDEPLDQGHAGVCLVETRSDIIARLKLATHSTAVRCRLATTPDYDSDDDDDDCLYDDDDDDNEDALTDDVVDDEARFFRSHDADETKHHRPTRAPMSSRRWIRDIGRDLTRWNAVEAGAFVLTPLVFDALTKLARTAPYFTLSEALGHFCGGPTSTLRAMHTMGRPWIAVETAQQHVDASLASGSPLFRFLGGRDDDDRDDEEPRVTRGVAVAVELCDARDRIGVFKTTEEPRRDDDEEEALVVQREEDAVTLRRKVSSGSLAALLDTYEKSDDRPVDMVLAVAPGKSAMAVFMYDVAPGRRQEGVVYPTTMRKRRRVLLPSTDIQSLRFRLFTGAEPALAVRVERRIPVCGYVVLACACIACASTSAFERELPDAVSGPLRSVWRQSVTTVLLAIVEIARRDQCTSSSSSSSCRRRRAPSIETTKSLVVAAVAAEPKQQDLLKPPSRRRPSQETYLTTKRRQREARDQFLRRLLRGLVSVEVDVDFVSVLARVILGFAVQNIALCVAFLFVPTPVALVLVNATPLWLVCWASVNGDGTHPVVAFGTLVGFLGAVILCTAELSESEQQSTMTHRRNPVVGVVVGIVGGIGGAVYVTAARRAKMVPPTRLLFLANCGALVLSILVVFAENPDGLPPLFDPNAGLGGWCTTRRNFLDSVGLSLVVDGVGVLGILYCLGIIAPLVVTVALQLEPVLASLVDAIVGVGTLASLTPTTAFGTAIVLIGCTIVVANSGKSNDDIDASTALEHVSAPSEKPLHPVVVSTTTTTSTAVPDQSFMGGGATHYGTTLPSIRPSSPSYNFGTTGRKRTMDGSVFS